MSARGVSGLNGVVFHDTLADARRRAAASLTVSRRMPVARPVCGSMLTIVPLMRRSPVATSYWVGRKVRRRLHDAVDRPAEDALVRAGHAHVALESRATGQDLLVGRGHVRVRAQHGADAAVQVPAHQLLVAGGFGVEIDEDHPDIRRQCGQHPVGGVERTVDRRHEDPAEQREDRNRTCCRVRRSIVVARGPAG